MKKMDKETKKLLQELIDPISAIDGGCKYCIKSFIENINAILKKLGIDARYDYDDEFDNGVVLIFGK